MGYLTKNMLFRFRRLAKYHESKNKRHRSKILCGSQKRAKGKKADAEKGRCFGQEFGKTTIENPRKALEESHHN